jgi:hypothetical protein
MDPYLEDPAFWRDFNLTFMCRLSEAIGEALSERYDARLAETIQIVKMSPEVRKLIHPDIEMNRESGQTKPEFLEEVRQTRIEILHRPDRTLVAVLELLSPYSKSGEGFDEYRAKRKTILLQKVHLVELDLLIGGKRLPLSKPLPKADYYALISRAEDRPNCAVYHWRLRDRLPPIPIPLRAPHADIQVELSEVFRDTYERGRYARSLFYSKPPTAPLARKDAQWASGVAAKNARKS